MEIEYHINCYNCGKVFITEESWADICPECEIAYKEYGEYLKREMKDCEYIDMESWISLENSDGAYKKNKYLIK